MLTKIIFIWAVVSVNTGDVQVHTVPAPSMEACQTVAASGLAESNAAKYGYVVRDARCEIVEWAQ